jgi:hypothetical protein
MHQSLDLDADPKSCDTNIRKKMAVSVLGLGDAVYAVNCGGEAHTDIFGIRKAIFIFFLVIFVFKSVLWIPDPYVFRPPGSGYVIICSDPIWICIRIRIESESESGSFHHQAKIERKTLISTVLCVFMT